jgi:hypothetical protein
LSSDELQFIAGFLGACILEEDRPSEPSRARLAECIERHHQQADGSANAAAHDRDHKMILLREYLSRAGRDKQPAAWVRHAAAI